MTITWSDKGIRALLEATPDLHVIAEVADGLQAVDVAEDQQPDILIVDMMMPGLNGLDVIKQVTRRSPNTRIIVLSMQTDETYVLGALKHGADGYVLKESSAEHLVTAIHTVLEGNRYLSEPLTERAIDAYIDQASQQQTEDPYEQLTPREREVLHLAAESYTNPQIAERLSISPRTAENHRANVMRKLHLKNQTDLIRYAIKRGIISLDG
jgi:two-component system response regulator NreC